MNDSPNIKSINELLPSTLINEMEDDTEGTYGYDENNFDHYDENADDDEIVDDLAYRPKPATNASFNPITIEPKTRFHSDSTIQMLYQYQLRQQMQTQSQTQTQLNPPSSNNMSNYNGNNANTYLTIAPSIRQQMYQTDNQVSYYNNHQKTEISQVPFMFNQVQNGIRNLSFSPQPILYPRVNQNDKNSLINNPIIFAERKGTCPDPQLHEHQIYNEMKMYNNGFNSKGYNINNNNNNNGNYYNTNTNNTNTNNTNNNNNNNNNTNPNQNFLYNSTEHEHKLQRKNFSTNNLNDEKNNYNNSKNKEIKKKAWYNNPNKKQSISSSSNSQWKLEGNVKQHEIEEFEKYISSLPNGVIESLCNQKRRSGNAKSLNKAPSECKTQWINWLNTSLTKIMMDVYGNYFIQEMIRKLSFIQLNLILNYIWNDFVKIAKDYSGTHVLQAMLDLISDSEQQEHILNSIQEHELEMAYNNNATHVWQKIITTINEKQREGLNIIIIDNFKALCLDANGIWLVKKFISHSCSSEYKARIMEILKANTIEIAQSPYGNYLIQFLLETWGMAPVSQ